MRVCIPIEFRAEGGGYYFLNYFERYLKSIDWEVTRKLQEQSEVLFTNHWMVSRESIEEALLYNPRLRIVHRIDGSAQDYGRKAIADNNQASVNRYADLTIFQSEYCRFSTRQKFQAILKDGPVIYNPVDVDLFSPKGEKATLPGKVRAVAVTWSTNPLKGFSRIYEVARQNPEIEFILCGNFPEAPKLPNLHNKGVLSREPLARVLRSCHFLVTFSQNEACPNHVLEALASGLPVLYLDSGAMPEIVADCGFAITVENFPRKATQLINRQSELSFRARKRACEQFSIENVLPFYRREIEKAVGTQNSKA